MAPYTVLRDSCKFYESDGTIANLRRMALANSPDDVRSSTPAHNSPRSTPPPLMFPSRSVSPQLAPASPAPLDVFSAGFAETKGESRADSLPRPSTSSLVSPVLDDAPPEHQDDTDFAEALSTPSPPALETQIVDDLPLSRSSSPSLDSVVQQLMPLMKSPYGSPGPSTIDEPIQDTPPLAPTQVPPNLLDGPLSPMSSCLSSAPSPTLSIYELPRPVTSTQGSTPLSPILVASSPVALPLFHELPPLDDEEVTLVKVERRSPRKSQQVKTEKKPPRRSQSSAPPHQESSTASQKAARRQRTLAPSKFEPLPKRPSAAATRVKKRKVPEGTSGSEQPLKRAKLRAPKQDSGPSKKEKKKKTQKSVYGKVEPDWPAKIEGIEGGFDGKVIIAPLI